MVTIISFGLSLLTASILILVKTIELKKSRRNLLLKLISSFDDKYLSLAGFLKLKGFQIFQTLRYLIIFKSKNLLLHIFENSKNWFMNELKERQKEIMGHREISRRGSVSFYLKRISEEKSRGKIEDR